MIDDPEVLAKLYAPTELAAMLVAVARERDAALAARDEAVKRALVSTERAEARLLAMVAVVREFTECEAAFRRLVMRRSIDPQDDLMVDLSDHVDAVARSLHSGLWANVHQPDSPVAKYREIDERHCCRADDPGWRLVAMRDPSGRRGLWFRSMSGLGVELCAGREGDDSYASFRVGDVISLVHVRRLVEVMMDVAWTLDSFYESHDMADRGDPSLQAVVRLQHERDEARGLLAQALEAGLAECDRLRRWPRSVDSDRAP